MIVVSDTSPIANMIVIQRLELLRQVFQKVVIPPTVHREIEALQDYKVDISSYITSNWIEVKAPSNKEEVIGFCA